MALNRRSFLKTGAMVAGSGALAPFAIGSGGKSANSKLNVAFVGLGTQGGRNLVGIMNHANIVGLCDVNERRLGKNIPEDLSSVPRFEDCRIMLDKLDKDIDAVVVSTPDHAHFWTAYTAMQRGKHVFVEKPLTHTVWEARKLAEAAKKYKLVTQTGNFGRASEGIRRLKEWCDAGVLGAIREVHAIMGRPREIHKIKSDWKLAPVSNPPDYLNWDLWLGSNPKVPYRRLDGGWRTWWAFGSGVLGDWAPHILDGANYALDLSAPSAVESDVSRDYSNGLRTPNSTHTVFTYPKRGNKPALKVHWYTGGRQPENKQWRLPEGQSALLIVGDKHALTANCRSMAERIITMNDKEWLDFRRNAPPKVIPRIKGGHYKEWIDAIVGDGPAPGANFGETGPFTEALMMGAICERSGGGRLEWDAKNMQITNNKDLNSFVNPPARKGFDIGRS